MFQPQLNVLRYVDLVKLNKGSECKRIAGGLFENLTASNAFPDTFFLTGDGSWNKGWI